MGRRRKGIAFERRYRHFTPIDGDFRCFYCGAISDSVDHQPPLIHQEVAFPEEIEFVTVPCCRECNSFLGGTFTSNLMERYLLLKERMASRNVNILSSPEWKEEEISELGRGMRGFIRQSKLHKQAIKIRLEYNSGINSWNDR